MGNKEWGTKTDFKSYAYFLNEYMGGVFTYGIKDAGGKDRQAGRFYRDASDNQVLPIEGEKRTDAKP